MYLLDTYALIVLLSDPGRMRSGTRLAIAASDPQAVHVSPASLWEIEIKVSIGKLSRPASDLGDAIRRRGWTELPIRFEHAVAAGQLPPHHRDPFDRMLVAQALAEHLTVVKPDPLFGPYGVPVLDC